MDVVKLIIRILSISIGILLYVAIWVWFIITHCDDSYNFDLREREIFFLWVMLHVSCIFGLILWAWS